MQYKLKREENIKWFRMIMEADMKGEVFNPTELCKNKTGYCACEPDRGNERIHVDEKANKET